MSWVKLATKLQTGTVKMEEVVKQLIQANASLQQVAVTQMQMSTNQQKVHKEAMRAQAETNALLVEANRLALKEQHQINLQMQEQIQAVSQRVHRPQGLVSKSRAASFNSADGSKRGSC